MRIDPASPIGRLPSRPPAAPRPALRAALVPPPARLAVATSAYGHRAAVDGDVEVSVRVFAEGGSVTVMRRIALDADGVTRRTIGIEAVIR